MILVAGAPPFEGCWAFVDAKATYIPVDTISCLKSAQYAGFNDNDQHLGFNHGLNFRGSFVIRSGAIDLIIHKKTDERTCSSCRVHFTAFMRFVTNRFLGPFRLFWRSHPRRGLVNKIS